MVWYEIAGRVLYYIALPVVSILILLFHILQAILSPFVSIARGIFNICTIPYHIAAKFEVLSSPQTQLNLTIPATVVLHRQRDPHRLGLCPRPALDPARVCVSLQPRQTIATQTQRPASTRTGRESVSSSAREETAAGRERASRTRGSSTAARSESTAQDGSATNMA